MVNNFIKRDLRAELWDDLSRKEICLLIGPRQSGKTTLMKSLQRDLEKRGDRTLFFSLDFEYDREFFVSQQQFLKKVEMETGGQKAFVFIDEIQRKEDAGIFLKGIYDMGLPYKLIVSGSGSIDLKAKVRESMAGRKRVYELYPLSLTEFINFKTEYRYEKSFFKFLELEKKRSGILLHEYLNYGGYPGVVLEPESREKMRVMEEIYRSYIEKDIAYIMRVEKTDAFSLLIKVLADQAGRLINYSELSNTLGLSLPTVKNYLWYAENTFILERLTPFFKNVRSEISKSPVAYFIDLGFRNYALRIFGNLFRPDDLGFAFQNLVFLILREKLKWSNMSIHYWRTKSGAEVDFVIDSGREVIPVEVKYGNIARPFLPKNLEGFAEKNKPKRCYIINGSLSAMHELKGYEVRFLTVWDLLSEEMIS